MQANHSDRFSLCLVFGKIAKLIYHKYANALHAKKHPEGVDRSQQNGN